jgi:hypothetical protein
MAVAPMPSALSKRILGLVYGRLAALVFAFGLGLRDAFELALFAKVGLELCEYAQHIEEGFACGGAGVDWLLSGLQRGALGFYSANDVLQVTDATGQPIERVTINTSPGRRKSRMV